MVDVLLTRPYLIHRDGRVVWSQNNAFMDTSDIVMYGDLVLGPFRARSGLAPLAISRDGSHPPNSAPSAAIA